jgi:hypothetical protein
VQASQHAQACQATHSQRQHDALMHDEGMLRASVEVPRQIRIDCFVHRADLPHRPGHVAGHVRHGHISDPCQQHHPHEKGQAP